MRVLINAFYCSQNASRTLKLLGVKTARDVILARFGEQEGSEPLSFRETLFYFIEFFLLVLVAGLVSTDKFPSDNHLKVQRFLRNVVVVLKISSAHAWDNSWIK